MSIDQRQFEQLSEMGISLWQRRAQIEDTNSVISTANAMQNTYQVINLNELAANQCFNDILLALDLTIGEVKQQNDHLDLGLVNWYFIDAKDADDQVISQLNNKLITPTIKLIAQSAKLKKQLWQTISQQLT